MSGTDAHISTGTCVNAVASSGDIGAGEAVTRLQISESDNLSTGVTLGKVARHSRRSDDFHGAMERASAAFSNANGGDEGSPACRRGSGTSADSFLSVKTPGSEDDTGTPRRRRSFFANIDEEDDDEDEQGFMFAPDQTGLEPLKAVILALQELYHKVETRIDPDGNAGPNSTTSMKVFLEEKDRSTVSNELDREVLLTLSSSIASLEAIFGSGLFEANLLASTHVRNILRTRLAKLNRSGDDDRAVASWVENTFAEGMLCQDDEEPVRFATAPPLRSQSQDSLSDFIYRSSLNRRESDTGVRFKTPLSRRESERPAGESPEPGMIRPTRTRLGRAQSLKEKRVSPSRISTHGKGKRYVVRGPVFSTECDQLLSSIGQWDMNIFRLDVLSQGRPLTALGMRLFESSGLMKHFKIPPVVLTRFFIAVEDEYQKRDAVPYHNNIHAADVLHSTSVLLSDKRIGNVSRLELLAAYLAAAVHDVAHPGLTNQFLIETGHDIAMLYNDKSVLENYHCATAFRLMSDEKLNVLATLNKEDRVSVRKMMIGMVLGTDMAQHFQHLAEFRAVVDSLKTSPTDLGNSSRHVGRTSSGGHSDKMGFPDMDQKVLMCAVVHLADMGNPTKPWEICQEWTFCLLKEFFRQGDLEKSKGIPVGPLHDRDKVNIPKSQIGFIDFIVLPLWETWDSFVGNAVMFENLMTNRDKWSEMAEATDGSAEAAAACVNDDPHAPIRELHQEDTPGTSGRTSLAILREVSNESRASRVSSTSATMDELPSNEFHPVQEEIPNDDTFVEDEPTRPQSAPLRRTPPQIFPPPLPTNVSQSASKVPQKFPRKKLSGRPNGKQVETFTKTSYV